MDNRKLKAAVISAGMIANQGHIPAYRTMPDEVSIEAVCDISASAAQDTAARHGIARWYTDAGTMLREVEPDIVSVCTPNNTHTRLVTQSLEAGANVICEKPIALHYAETKALYDLAQQKKRTLVACQTSRFVRPYFAARDYIASGAMGNLYYAEIDRIRRRGVPTWGTFHKKSASGGGALADIGVHALDALFWMLGNPHVESVSGGASAYIIHSESGVIYDQAESGAFSGVYTSHPFSASECDVEEFASGTIRAEHGIMINFKIAWAANLPSRSNMTILGSSAGLTLPELTIHGVQGENQTDMRPRLFGMGEFDALPFAGHYYLIRHVVHALKGWEELLVRPEETLNISAVIDLFYRSAEAGREVAFNEL